MKRQVACKPRAPISERPAGPLAAQCLVVPGEGAMRFFVGLDWASEAHAVCLIDGRGRVRWQTSVAHSAAGLATLVQRLRRWRQRGPLAIAIERPSGLVVDTLVQAGLDVVPIHPNVVKATRPRYSAAGGKSDPGDAFLLADLLRTDGHRFRPLQPPSDDTRALRTLVRGRDDLVAQRVALANQLRALLERVWPVAAQIQQLGAAIAAALQHHPDAPVVQSLPRGGTINAAQILAELGDERRRFSSAEHLAAEAGVAPVTHASGKHHGVAFRWACNKRLRAALTTFANNSRHASAWAATVYQRAVGRGCDHPHAIRILARAWVRILWRCWQNRTPYDLSRHGAAAALAAA